MATMEYDTLGNGRRTDKRENSAAWKKLRAQVIREESVCWLCNEPVDKEIKWPDKSCAVVDHIIPYVSGGTDSRDNVALAHNSCNLSKGKKDADTVRKDTFTFDW